jgi:hypothetical protein
MAFQEHFLPRKVLFFTFGLLVVAVNVGLPYQAVKYFLSGYEG